TFIQQKNLCNSLTGQGWVYKTTPNAFFYLFKQLRKRNNEPHRLIKLVKEFISKADSLLLIP
ncbi:MAG: hypothetical protein AABY54_05300, partial [Deltaproteobacteria bacterium]